MTEVYYRARVDGQVFAEYTTLQAALLCMNHRDHPRKPRSITMIEEDEISIRPVGVAHFRADKREPILMEGRLNKLMREAAA